MYYKLGQACVTNWGSFLLLQIMANVVKNWGTSLLQIRATVITKYSSFYKLGKNVLQIGAGNIN